MVWYEAPLDDVDDPGDKGIGLRELRLAGLRTPSTVVLGQDPIGPPLPPTGAWRLFRQLDVPDYGRVVLRPSLRVARSSAASVSGLYESIGSDRSTLMSALDRVNSEYCGPDRAVELAMLGTRRASSSMLILVQPLIAPIISGVAHIHARSGDPRLRLGIVTGHLAKLVSGEVPGWQCELTAADFGSGREVALIADEDDAAELRSHDGLSNILVALYEDLMRLWSQARESREIEWASDENGLWYLQSQPLTNSGQTQ
jgi:hypothetical protein